MSKIKVRVVLLALGVYYFLFPAFMLIFNAIHKQLTDLAPPNEVISNLTILLHEIWNYYLPLLMIIGAAYLLCSLFYPHIKKFTLIIHTILTIALAIWCYYYILSSGKFIQLLLQSTGYKFEKFNVLFYGAYTFGIIGLIIMYAIPQIAIGIFIIYKNKIRVN